MNNEQTDSTKEATSNVFTLAATGKTQKRSKDKWPDIVLSRGYSMVPSILLWGQGRLELEPDELNVLLQLISHWWSADHDPHPAKETIARRMGKTPRTVQRHLTSLENKGFIKRVTRFKRHQGQDSNGYDLSGLIAKLEAIAPEFEKVSDLNKRRRAKAEAKTA
jgi:DNA-binding transcriptional ArsR family regulator